MGNKFEEQLEKEQLDNKTITEIEDTLNNSALPVNSKAMLNRLMVLLEENKTNSLESCKEDIRVKKVMWLLNSQVHGQLANIDMCKDWDKLTGNE